MAPRVGGLAASKEEEGREDVMMMMPFRSSLLRLEFLWWETHRARERERNRGVIEADVAFSHGRGREGAMQ